MTKEQRHRAAIEAFYAAARDLAEDGAEDREILDALAAVLARAVLDMGGPEGGARYLRELAGRVELQGEMAGHA